MVFVGLTAMSQAYIPFRASTDFGLITAGAAHPDTLASAFYQVYSTDTGIDTLDLAANTLYTKVGIQMRFTKLSGTPAGTARLYGSNFGTTGTWVAVGDTMTLTNVTDQAHQWDVSLPMYRKWRLLRSGATTVRGRIACVLVGKQ